MGYQNQIKSNQAVHYACAVLSILIIIIIYRSIHQRPKGAGSVIDTEQATSRRIASHHPWTFSGFFLFVCLFRVIHHSSLFLFTLFRKKQNLGQSLVRGD